MIKTETQKRNYDQFFKKIIELYKKKILFQTKRTN